jgi:hypothetical protein
MVANEHAEEDARIYKARLRGVKDAFGDAPAEFADILLEISLARTVLPGRCDKRLYDLWGQLAKVRDLLRAV